MSQNRAKRLSGINTLAYLGIEPTTAPLLIVKYNNETPTTDDRVGNQIGAVWVSMNTAANVNDARIFVLTRLDGSGPSGIATWTELMAGGGGINMFVTDNGDVIPAFDTVNETGGNSVGGVAININTFADPNLSNNMRIALNNSIFFPNTTAITSGVIGFGGSGNVNRFIHNFGVNNTFVGMTSGNFTLTGNNSTGIGNAALNGLTSGTDNCALGASAGLLINTGSNNVTIGSLAGSSITSGSNNVAIGQDAMISVNNSELVAVGKSALEIYSSVRAVAVGYQALNLAAAACDNLTAVGWHAGFNAITSSSSTFIGANAGATCSGIRNVFVGQGVGQSGCTGAQNTGIGTECLEELTSGANNTACGRQALNKLTTGSSNIGIGQAAAFNLTTSSDSIAIGLSSLTAATTNGRNISIGSQSMSSCNEISSIENVSIGYQSMLNFIRGDHNVVLGSGSMLNAGLVGGAAANIVIGASSLLVNDRGGGIGDEGTGNIIIGNASAQSADQSYGNTVIGGGFANNWNSDEHYNVYIHGGAGVAGEDNTLRIGGATGTGVGQLNAAFICGIRGITTGVADAVAVLVDSANQLGTVSSSKRYKDDIQDMNDASSNVMDLRPVTFTYKSDKQKRIQYGLIAEEVEKSMPRLVVHDEEGLPQTIKYHDLPALLLNELQKLEKRISKLEKLCSTCKHSIK